SASEDQGKAAQGPHPDLADGLDACAQRRRVGERREIHRHGLVRFRLTLDAPIATADVDARRFRLWTVPFKRTSFTKPCSPAKNSSPIGMCAKNSLLGTGQRQIGSSGIGPRVRELYRLLPHS